MVLHRCLFVFIFAISWLGTNTALAENDAIANISADVIPGPEGAQLHDALADVIRSIVPAEYEDDKHWALKKRVYAGIKLRHDGDWKWETERRFRELNHGTWYRSKITLVDPGEKLKVTAQPLTLDNHRRYKFDIGLLADATLWGQWARWNYGVQAISLSTDGDATIEVRIAGSVGFRLDGTAAIPDVTIDPHVDHATISLHRFNIRHVSDVGGEAAQQLGKLTKSILEDHVIAPQQERLVDKLNQKIEQKRERLKISPSQWFQQWLLSEDLQQ